MAMLDQTPVQIAWVTADLDATEQALTSLLRARRWVRMPAVHFSAETCSYRGRPADFVADISLSYAGDTQLELIAPVSGQSVYTEFLDRHGAGLHHICIELPTCMRSTPNCGMPKATGHPWCAKARCREA
ncbi:flavoprotein [Mycolicibacterium conceptionense]|uniref:Flavoprotein n=1 Tax=Mycolicibacterium conceptionense TaxID=451644 RepID=A0A0U1DLY5_9MYCO|nr:flavoprotein [Mycolicibacterium conceptionense]